MQSSSIKNGPPKRNRGNAALALLLLAGQILLFLLANGFLFLNPKFFLLIWFNITIILDL